MNKEKIDQRLDRKKYRAKFKDQVLLRAETDGISQVAQDLRIKDSLIYAWRAKRKQGGSILRKKIEVRYAMIKENTKQFPTNMMCRLLSESATIIEKIAIKNTQ